MTISNTENEESKNKRSEKDYILSFGRRTGRVRFISLNLLATSILMLSVFGLEFLNENFSLGEWIQYFLLIPVLWLVLIVIQRHMDIGGRLVGLLMFFIPILNLAYIFSLVFGKGADYRNEYGPIPFEKPYITAILLILGLIGHGFIYSIVVS